MELRHLRCFLAIADSRNLSRAASRLRVAQPALSRQIRDLERELGVPLLDRHAKGVTLTFAGEAFARGATDVLAALTAALEKAKATAEGRRGRVVFGATRPAIAKGTAAALVDALRVEHPEITLVTHDADPPEVWEHVSDGTCDIALSFFIPGDPALIGELLWEEVVDHVILPVNHPLASRAALSIPELASLPVVIPSRATPSRILERVYAGLNQAGLRSPILGVDGGIRTMHMAVGAGRGWSLITRSLAKAPPPGTVAIPLEREILRMDATAIWRRTERRPVVRTVLETLFRIVRQYPDCLLQAEPALPAASGHSRRRPAPVTSTGIEIRHLRALLGVAATQTIGRAAEQLGVTQPALSRQLRELEHAVSLSLLERSARGVTLSTAGAALAGDTPDLLLTIERMIQEIGRAKRGMEGSCVVGAVATAVSGELLAGVLAASADRYPHIRVSIEELPTPLQPKALGRGDIDLGLAHAYPGLDDSESGKFVTKLVKEDLVDSALLNPTHPLANRTEIAPAELGDVPFLFMGRSFHPKFYDRIMTALKEIGLAPRIEMTYDALHVVWSLVAQGKGWCLGFHSQRARPPFSTVAVPVTGFAVPWGITLLSRQDERSPAVRAVAALFPSVGRSSGPLKRPSGATKARQSGTHRAGTA